jgi:hypothetical protein
MLEQGQVTPGYRSTDPDTSKQAFEQVNMPESEIQVLDPEPSGGGCTCKGIDYESDCPVCGPLLAESQACRPICDTHLCRAKAIYTLVWERADRQTRYACERHKQQNPKPYTVSKLLGVMKSD